MARYISHYLVNWDGFCAAWAEEEHPLDALEGAETRTTYDDTFSSTYWLEEQFARFEKSAPPDDWLPRLRACANACQHRGDHKDLADEFAHQEGGFTITMSPATVAWIASNWDALPHAEVHEQLSKVLGEAEGSLVVRYVRSRMEVIALAAVSGRGYVACVG